MHLGNASLMHNTRLLSMHQNNIMNLGIIPAIAVPLTGLLLQLQALDHPRRANLSHERTGRRSLVATQQVHPCSNSHSKRWVANGTADVHVCFACMFRSRCSSEPQAEYDLHAPV